MKRQLQLDLWFLWRDLFRNAWDDLIVVWNELRGRSPSPWPMSKSQQPSLAEVAADWTWRWEMQDKWVGVTFEIEGVSMSLR